MSNLSVIVIVVKAKSRHNSKIQAVAKSVLYHHIRDRSRGRYDDSIRSHTSTPPIPWLYIFTTCGCSAVLLCSFL